MQTNSRGRKASLHEVILSAPNLKSSSRDLFNCSLLSFILAVINPEVLIHHEANYFSFHAQLDPFFRSVTSDNPLTDRVIVK